MDNMVFFKKKKFLIYLHLHLQSVSPATWGNPTVNGKPLNFILKYFLFVLLQLH